DYYCGTWDGSLKSGLF
nr:immunoglobulin light chain junction region [Macaca mulatta]